MHNLQKYTPKVIAFLLLVIGYGSLFIMVYYFNYTAEKAQFFCSILFLVTCICLETLIPFRKDWSFWKDKQSVNDIVLYLFNSFFLFKINFILINFIERHHLSFSFWPTQLPIFIQLLLAFIVFDFIYYWFHRLSHTIYFVWMFHAVHHSGTKMHTFKGNRSNLFLDALPFSFIFVFFITFFHLFIF